jgi:hypothetical protein
MHVMEELLVPCHANHATSMRCGSNKKAAFVFNFDEKSNFCVLDGKKSELSDRYVSCHITRKNRSLLKNTQTKKTIRCSATTAERAHVGLFLNKGKSSLKGNLGMIF